ncbi:uncharacterized protein LOC123209945 [Mangifera indica]|uniref:uncharacterized protein LOC123209945 n=1 Tax=Mangifera indica TaxID=29780 RepID=UPI001CFBAA24|nr:uncharacterized protein LOC123209945 [Mangifera indica]
MMPISSSMGDELKFPQRWDFRRKDESFDSSNNNSKSNSISESVLKDYDYDETNNNTSKLQQNLDNDSGFEDQFRYDKIEEKKVKRSKKKDCCEQVNRKKSKTSAYVLGATSDVKSFTEALLEDLKATRENLFTWMREEINKMIADDTAPRKRRRKGASRGKKVQSLQQNDSEKMEVQSQKNFKKNLKLKHQKTTEEGMQQQNNFQGQSMESFVKNTKAADANNHCQVLDDQVDAGKATDSMISEDKAREGRLALTSNSNLQSSSSDQYVKLQHPKSVVLAIQAQNYNDGSSKRTVVRTKRADSNKLCQVPEDRTGYSISMASCEKDKATKLRLPVEQNYRHNSSSSSMYSTLPTFLSESPALNSKLDTSFLCNLIQPRVEGNKTTVNLERANQVLDSSTYCGYLPSIQQEERGGDFSQMVSRTMSPFDQNGIPSSSTGTGYPVPLQQGMAMGIGGLSSPGQFYFENNPRENCNMVGLRMNGGAITFSGGNYELSDHLVADNLYSHLNYKADSRFLPYQIPSNRDGFLFPK